MIREASCHCQHLVLECTGEPAAVSLCHCLDCQRRTGSAFGIGAFFAQTSIAVAKGSSTKFRRAADSGSSITFHFCGVCGSTVWWEPERLPSMVGVAVGAFADPSFPAPRQATWDNQQHHWLHLPDAMVSCQEGAAPRPPQSH